MEQLTPETIAGLLERFGDFHDSIIRRVSLQWDTNSPSDSRACVILSAQDLESTINNGWLNFTFHIVGLVDLAVHDCMYRTYDVVFNLAIAHLDGLFYLDFGSASNNGTIGEFERSPFYIAGRAVSWELGPYQE